MRVVASMCLWWQRPTLLYREQLSKAVRQALFRLDARLEEQESTNRVQAFEIKCAPLRYHDLQTGFLYYKQAT